MEQTLSTRGIPFVLVTDTANDKQFYRYPNGSAKAATESDLLFFHLHVKLDQMADRLSALESQNAKATPTPVHPQPEPESESGEASLISINEAAAADLTGIDGIGPKTAEEIIAGRPWVSVESLRSSKISAFKGGGANKILERLKL